MGFTRAGLWLARFSSHHSAKTRTMASFQLNATEALINNSVAAGRLKLFIPPFCAARHTRWSVVELILPLDMKRRFWLLLQRKISKPSLKSFIDFAIHGRKVNDFML